MTRHETPFVIDRDLIIVEAGSRAARRQADHYGYGRGLALVGVALGSLAAAVIGAVVSAVVGRGVHHSAMSTGTADASPLRPS